MNGNFEFSSLPLGSYILQAESTGLFSEPLTVTLTEEFPTANGLELNLFKTNITGISQTNIEDLQIGISPNPVKETLNLTINSPRNQEVSMVIFGLAGTKIRESKESLKSGNNIFSVSVGNFPAGVYFLKVSSNDGSINRTLKFIK